MSLEKWQMLVREKFTAANIMTISQPANDFINLLRELRSKKIIKSISYPLSFIYIGILIRKWTNKKIAEIERKLFGFVANIEKEVESQIRVLIEKDTFLIYRQREELLSLFERSNKDLLFLRSNRKLFDDQFNKSVNHAISRINDSIVFVKKFNDVFVQKRKVKYAALWSKSSFPLDDNQLTAVIKDDKHNLIVAGAGSGKTETLITRIAYLINRAPDTIKPNKILALAFQAKAALEIKERLQQRFGVDIKVKTFHALGNEILQMSAMKTGKKIPKLKFSGDNFEKEYRKCIQNLFNKSIENPEDQNDLINYMKLYADDQIVKKEADFETREDFFKYMRGMKYTALDGTKVKSEGERDILNFFICHKLNGKNINILYEAPAIWMKYDAKKGEMIPKPDFFFPEFNLYLEHWAINKSGQVPKWFDALSQESYKKSMELKRQRFEESEKFRLIEMYAWERNDGKFLEILEKRFVEAFRNQFPGQEVKLERMGYCELVERVWDDCRKSTKSLPLNVGRFIVIAKTYCLTADAIIKRINDKEWTPKQKAFAKLAAKIFQLYEKELHADGSIDFADMINLAVRELRENNELYRNEYEHILIDEYQDISTQRYELIKELMRKSPECRLFCVGDDWQSIMGFSGARLGFFVNFDKYFDHPSRTDLSVNYRSIKSVVDTGALIINQNGDAQLKKITTASNSRIKKVKVYSFLHKSGYRENYFKQMAHHCVDRVGEYLRNGYLPKDIMILTRIVNNPVLTEALIEYARRLRIPISIERNRNFSVPFMSVHRSKGLQAKVVFILGVDKDLYGFPCEIDNPDIFDIATMGQSKDKEEEERRLFYVAVTRAKEEVLIYSQECAESKFLEEISAVVEKEKVPYRDKLLTSARIPDSRKSGQRSKPNSN